MADITPPATATDAGERQQTVEALYVRNFSSISELIHSDPYISFDTETQITEGLAKHLPSYDGRLTDTAFRAWTTEIIVPLVGFHAIRRVSEPLIHAAIWRTLRHSFEPNKFDDYAELVRELTQDVLLWIYLHLDQLRKPGSAKITTTRIYERAVVMTRARLKQQQTRRAAVIRQVYDLPSKAQAERMAATMDAEASRAAIEQAAQQAEVKEILDEMKILGVAA